MSAIALSAALSFPLCLCVRLNEQDDKKISSREYMYLQI